MKTGFLIFYEIERVRERKKRIKKTYAIEIKLQLASIYLKGKLRVIYLVLVRPL